MSLPSEVFIDTSILRALNYNFSSAALSSFAELAKHRRLTLLLPEPTESEIQRHLRDFTNDALLALQEARRKAPFLRKWEGFPVAPNGALGNWRVLQVALKEWKTFLEQFKLERLGYDHVDLKEIMHWHAKKLPPFSVKKPKEFPDAIAIAALAAYAQKKNRSVAVVSRDSDFAEACQRFPALQHFPSLAQLVEAHLRAEEGVDAIRAIVSANLGPIEEAIVDATSAILFLPPEPNSEVLRSTGKKAILDSFRIVSVGHSHCTITFDAWLMVDHVIEVWRLVDQLGHHPIDVECSSEHHVSGEAKLQFDAGEKRIAGVPYIELNDHTLALPEL